MENGEEKVHQYIGRESSGKPYNSICVDKNRKPHNPLINAGAIMACSLIKMGADTLQEGERFAYLLGKYQELSGNIGEVYMDNATYLSGKEKADRNFALSYFMMEQVGFP